jgi:hypothetical protein
MPETGSIERAAIKVDPAPVPRRFRMGLDEGDVVVTPDVGVGQTDGGGSQGAIAAFMR